MRARTSARRAIAAAAMVTAMAVSMGTGVAGAATKPLTKQQFIERADAICTQGLVQGDQIAQQVFPAGTQEPSADQVAEYVGRLVPVVKQEIAKIRKLTPPKADAKRVKKILDQLGKELSALAKDPQKLLAGNVTAKSDRLAQQYGFTVCGQASSD